MSFELRLVKTARDAESAKRLAREALWLRELSGVRALEGQVPRLIEQGTDAAGRDYLVIDIQPGTGETRAFTPDHARFLASLGKARFRAAEFEHAGKCQWIQRSIAGLPRASAPLLEAAYADCEKALLYWSGPYVLSQGDFAPWNIRTFGSQLFVFDWGSAHADASPLDDVLHYLMIQRRLKSVRLLRRAMGRAQEFALAAYPEWSWRWPVIGALTLVYLLGVILHRMRNSAERAADPVVDAYWKLLEKRSIWMKEN
jgi:Phosphotransferase enzyme family